MGPLHGQVRPLRHALALQQSDLVLLTAIGEKSVCLRTERVFVALFAGYYWRWGGRVLRKVP